MAKAIMIQGTASGVGKTMLTLALCRIFKENGCTVAPFKAQNMTANTFITAGGEEIATSQWLQALAAGVEPCADMNPAIFKPSKGGSQIILNGKIYTEINLPEEDDLFDNHDQTADIENQIAKLANTIRQSVNMDLIEKILDEGV